MYGCAQPKTNPQDQIVENITFEELIPEDPQEIEDLFLYDACTNYDNNLSSIVKDITFIPLEMGPLVHYFHTFDITLSDDYIFLGSMHSIFQFDRSGNFIKKIGTHGQGPQEYVQLTPPIHIDIEKELVYATDEGKRKMMVFGFDALLKRSFPLPTDSNPRLLNDTVIILSQSLWDRTLENAPSIRFMDYSGKIIKSYQSHIYPYKGEKETSGSTYSFVWQNKEKFYSLEYASDTINRIEGTNLVLIRRLSGLNKPSGEDFFTRKTGDKVVICNYMFRPESGVYETDYFMIFKLLSQKESYYKVYNKATKEFHRTFYPNAQPPNSLSETKKWIIL